MSVRSRPTILDVAKRVGVSPTTVSYVLSGPKERADRISEETSARVREVVADVGYVPNQSARTLRLMRTNRVLFLANRFGSLYSQAIAESVQRELHTRGLFMSLQVGAGSTAIRNAIETLAQHSADGLIVETNDDHVDELHTAAEDGHAIVAIGTTSADPNFDVISNDIGGAVRQAMMHLCDQGYRRFVLLASSRDLNHDQRMSIAATALRTSGVTSDNISVIHCPHDRVGAHRAAATFLEQDGQPVAVYAGSDVSAIGVLWAALHRGLRVPEDVAIVGHGNSPETDITLPPLTNIGPLTLDFAKAAELIASRMKKPSLAGRHVIQPCQLTIRESTSNRS